MKSITELNAEKNLLIDSIRGDFSVIGNKEKLVKLKKIEIEIKDLELRKLIEEVNKKEMAKKDFLNDLLNVGEIDPDLFTNDGKLHKAKTKKNPKVTEFFTKYKWATLRVDYDSWKGTLKQVCVQYDGRKFSNTLLNSYTLPKEEQKQVLYKSLEEMCKYYGVLFEPLDYDKLKESLEKINKASELFEQQRKAYNEVIKEQGSYKLEECGFLYSSNSHQSILTSKF